MKLFRILQGDFSLFYPHLFCPFSLLYQYGLMDIYFAALGYTILLLNFFIHVENFQHKPIKILKD